MSGAGSGAELIFGGRRRTRAPLTAGWPADLGLIRREWEELRAGGGSPRAQAALERWCDAVLSELEGFGGLADERAWWRQRLLASGPWATFEGPGERARLLRYQAFAAPSGEWPSVASAIERLLAGDPQAARLLAERCALLRGSGRELSVAAEAALRALIERAADVGRRWETRGHDQTFDGYADDVAAILAVRAPSGAGRVLMAETAVLRLADRLAADGADGGIEAALLLAQRALCEELTIWLCDELMYTYATPAACLQRLCRARLEGDEGLERISWKQIAEEIDSFHARTETANFDEAYPLLDALYELTI